MITHETIQNISTLARLELSEEEKIQAAEDMEQMLLFVDKILELDVPVDLLSRIHTHNDSFREDDVIPWEETEDILSLAPERKDNYYKVPKTIE